MAKQIEFTKSEREKIINLYLKDVVAVGKIGKLFNRDGSTIMRILKEENVFMNSQERRKYFVKKGKIKSSKYLEFSEDKKSKVKQLYKAGESPINIAKYFGHDSDVIVLFLKKNNLYMGNSERKKYLYKIGKAECSRKIHLTDKQKSEIKSMYIGDVMSCEEISKTMDVSNAFIENFLGKEKILYDKYQRKKDRYNAGKITPSGKLNFTESQIGNIISFFVKEKKSSQEIGKIYKCSGATILKILREKNIYTSQKKIFNKEEKKQIIELYQNQGESINELSKRFKTYSGTMNEMLGNLGILQNNSDRRKYLFKSGKLKAWNENLTKEDPRVAKGFTEKSIACRFKKGCIGDNKNKTYEEIYGKEEAERIIKKVSDTKKKLFSEGKLKSWNVGITGYQIHDDEFKEQVRIWATGKRHTKQSKKKISVGNTGKVRTFEVRKKYSAIKQEIPIEEWKGFKAFYPYTSDFNENFKQSIRQRDDNTCLKCGKIAEQEFMDFNRKLTVHHINYKKDISIKENCCTVCMRCNIEANQNRKSWIKFYQSLLSEKYGYNYSKDDEIMLEVGVQRCN